MYIKPNTKDALSIFGLPFPYIFITGIFLFPLLFKKNKLIATVGIGLLLFSLPSMARYVQLPFSDRNHNGPLHVMNYNVMVGWKMLDKDNRISKDSYKKFSDLIFEEPQPGIICTQETSARISEIISNELNYPYLHSVNKKSPAIFSRYPIVDKGIMSFGKTLNACLWADIKYESDTIRVYSVHLESNRLSNSSYDFLARNEYETTEAIKGFKDFLIKYSQYSSKRAEQATQIKSHIDQCPYPVIVSGDFNDPPVSFTYKTLSKGLNDTFVNSGRGFGTTWSGAIPMLRIDYIFASEEMNNTGFVCYKSDLSDHYPIKASFDPDLNKSF